LVNIIEKAPDTMKYYHLVFIQIRDGELYKNVGLDIALLSINGNLKNKLCMLKEYEGYKGI
jgi:hypothetical protein